jgi:hypothetical protein
MVSRELGRAKYRAYRMFGIVHLVAQGETPAWNDKVDFEQLPFRIFPPMYGFYFVHQGNSIQIPRPFVYEEPILFPAGAHVVKIQDANGFHEVQIADVVPVDSAFSAEAADSGNNYCVFLLIGTNIMMIAKCDAILPAVYTKVFGPASHADCEKYIAANGDRSAAAVSDFSKGSGSSQVKVLQNTFKAWIDNMPMGGPKLIVIGDVQVPTGGWRVWLAPAAPQGYNPDILILDIHATPPVGPAIDVVTTIPLRYEEAPPKHPYTGVTIRHGGEFTIGVGHTQ